MGGRAIARVRGSNVEWTHADHLGSPAAATSLTGAVLWREDHTPFGEARQGPTQNVDNEGFTGHIADAATGLVYMQARYYDPVVGRFLSSDPVGFAQGGPAYFNRYVYTFNDPLNNWDPNGEQVFPRDDGSRTVIVYPRHTADHVDRRHSPTGTAANRFTQTLGHDRGKIMAMLGIERAVQNGAVVQQDNSTVYEGRLGGFFTNVGTQGENTVRVVTQDMTNLSDPAMLQSVAEELADPSTVAMLAALEAGAGPDASPIKIEVIITQYPVHEHNRVTTDRP